MGKEMNFISKITILFLIIFFSIIFSFANSNYLYIDEILHFDQIMRFARGETGINPLIYMIPFYHLTLSLIGGIFSNYSIQFMRIFSFLLSILTIPVFYLAAYSINKNSALLKTLQFSFLPIVFPFFFLLYTDVPSLFSVLLVLLLSLRKKYLIAGIASILAILIRQNNILWVIFVNTVIYLDKFGFMIKGEYLKKHIIKSLTFIVSILIFIIFIFFNRGFGVRGGAWPLFSLIPLGNIYLFLFCLFLLTIPLQLVYLPGIITTLRKKKYLLLLIILYLPLYLMTFKITHPWNRDPFFIRNTILLFFTSGLGTKLIFYLIIIYSLFSFLITKFERNYWRVLYLFSFIFLWFTWLIEPRYFIVTMTLFILVRKHENRYIESVIAGLFAVLSITLFMGMIQKRFFL